MLVVHYGNHEGTTGSHLGRAARDLRIGRALPRGHESHVRLADVDADQYLWVESSITSLPLDPERAPFLTAGYLIDVHVHLALSMLQAKLFDVVFVAQREALPAIRSVNPAAHWLPLAAPSSYLHLARDPRFPVGFVGNVKAGSAREAVLTGVADRVAMNDWRRSYTVREMGNVYRRSRVVVNPPLRGDLNMRFFEAMACGAVVLTDLIGNGQKDIAAEGTHFLGADFSNPSGVAAAAEMALRREDLEDIGAQGRSLIRQGHTYEDRIATVSDHMRGQSCTAPIRHMGRRERSELWAQLGAQLGSWGLSRRACAVDPLVPLRAPILAWRCAEASSRRSGGELVKRVSPRLPR